MSRSDGSGYALAAVFPAAAVPIMLPALRAVGAPDAAQGLIMGVLLGLAILLLIVSVKKRRARGGA